MASELLKTVLVLVIGFGLRWLLAVINVQLDEATFTAIVIGIATYFLTLLGYEGFKKAAPATFK